MTARGVYVSRITTALTTRQWDRFLDAIELEADRRGHRLTAATVMRDLVVRWTDVVLTQGDRRWLS